MAKIPEHRLFFESVMSRFPTEFQHCKDTIRNCIVGLCNEKYILSQNVVSLVKKGGISTKLQEIYGLHRFHQFLGMLIYDIITIDLRDKEFKGWEYWKTKVQERDYLQTIYFRSRCH